MAAESERNEPATTTGAAAVGDGLASPVRVEPRRSTGSRNAAMSLSSLQEEDTTTNLAAASEKLHASRRAEQKRRRKPRLSTCLKSVSPMKLLKKLRDLYVKSCVMAAEKGDFADLVGHGGLGYGDNVLSRSVSRRRDREREEAMEASLSRQASISLSRQQSQSGRRGMARNSSTRFSGLDRHASMGMPGLERRTGADFSGLNRHASTGMPGFGKQASMGTLRSMQMLGMNTAPRRSVDSNLFSDGRDTFLQQLGRGSPLSRAGQFNSLSSQRSHNVVNLPIRETDTQRPEAGSSAGSGQPANSKPVQ